MGLHLHTIVESGSRKQITEDFIQTEIALKWQRCAAAPPVFPLHSGASASATSDGGLRLQTHVQSQGRPPASPSSGAGALGVSG